MGDAEIREAIRRWRDSGDARARDELVERFMPLARSLARRYVSANEAQEDLVQVAAVGLLGSIDRFDPDRASSFVAFAVPTMLGELKRHFRNTGWSAHVPRGSQELALRIGRVSADIARKTGASPTVPQIAEALGLDIEAVLIGLEASQAHYAVSFDASTGEDAADPEPPPVADAYGASDEGYDLIETKHSIGAAITRLPHQQRAALRLRMRTHLTQREIGQRLGCSQMHVSRLLDNAARNVREQLEPSRG